MGLLLGLGGRESSKNAFAGQESVCVVRVGMFVDDWYEARDVLWTIGICLKQGKEAMAMVIARRVCVTGRTIGERGLLQSLHDSRV